MPRPLLKHELPAGIHLCGGQPSMQARAVFGKLLTEIGAWTNHRVARICEKLNWQLDAVCAWAGVIDQRRVARMWENQDWPMPVAIHLWKLEQLAFGRTIPDAQDVIAGLMINQPAPTTTE